MKSGTSLLQTKFFPYHTQINNIFSWSYRGKSWEKIKNLIERIKNLKEDDFNCQFKSISDELAAFILDNKLNVISDEGISSFIGYKQSKINYHVFERIRKITEYLKLKPEYLITLRNQSDYLISHYAQCRNSYRSFGINSFNHLIKEIKNLKNGGAFFYNDLNYINLLEKINQTTEQSNIHILLFEKLKDSNDRFLHELCKKLKISVDLPPIIVESVKENATYQSKGLKYAKDNQIIDLVRSVNILPESLNRYLPTEHIKNAIYSLFSERLDMNKNDTSEVKKLFHNGNNAISKKYIKLTSDYF